MVQHINKRKINEVDKNDSLDKGAKNSKKSNEDNIIINDEEIIEDSDNSNNSNNSSNNNSNSNNSNNNNDNGDKNNNSNNDNNDDSKITDTEHEIWNSIGLNSLDMKVLFQYIKTKGDLGITNNEGYGLIYLAAKNNSLEALRILLLQTDSLVNDPNGPFSELPLHAAASVGNFDAIELLLEHGSKVDLQDTLGHTPLSNSLFSSNYSCTELLIKSDSPIDTVDNQGNTLLHLAVSNHFTKAIPLLIQHGVSIDQANYRGLSPLALSIGFGYKDVVDELIKGGADVNGKTRFGKIVHHAVTWNRIDALESLLNAGADVNVVNAMEETPLLVAVQQRKIDMVRFLLKHGADPCFSPEDDTASSSSSPNVSLLYAANHGCTELCSLLINEKTSLYFIRQAADMSERASFPLTAKYLRNRLYQLNNNNNNNNSSSNNGIENNNNNNNDNMANGTDGNLALPTSSLNDDDTNRNFENDFNSLINTFSDDEDTTSINTNTNTNNSTNNNGNNNNQSQPSHSTTITS
ncbi:unnamed protein product [Cunninghamella blakesleeana]